MKAKPTKGLDVNVGIDDIRGMLKSYLEQRGNLTRLARTVGVSHSTVLGWAAGRVPAERVRAVAAATGIPPHELRPDIFEPSTVGADHAAASDHSANHDAAREVAR